MKVILSVDSIRYPLTGIGRYTLELGRQLAQADEIDELRFYSHAGFVDALPVPTDTEPGRPLAPIRIAADTIRRTPKQYVGYTLHRGYDFARRGLGRIKRMATPFDPLRGSEDSLFHGPNFDLPRLRGRGVVTIHDLSIYAWSHYHPPERVRYLRRAIADAVKRSALVITDSEFIRQEIAAHFGLSLEHIHAVPLSSGAEFHPRTAEAVAPVLDRHGLRFGGYALYTGTIEPRKNLGRLIDAYGRLPQAVRQRYPLVLAGYAGWKNIEIMDRIARGEEEGWLRYLGFVPNADLPHLFSGARLFAFPSVYEGFGLPVLEAMASGVPVVCSTASSLPEVAGEAALMSAPEDVEALTDNLARGLEDEAWRREAIANGHAQAARFSWRRCAEETMTAYRKALAA